MKRHKRFIFITVAVLMIVTLFSACTGNQQEAENAVSVPEDTVSAIEETRSYPYTFEDLAGNSITLEKEVEKVYIAGSVQPLLSVYLYYNGGADGLVSAPEVSKSIIESSLFNKVWPEIASLTPHKEDINIEEVLLYGPDVVFLTGNGEGENYEALKNAGLNVISFPTAASGNEFDTFAATESWLSQMAEVFGDTSASDALIKYNEDTKYEVAEALKSVPEEDKKQALIIFQLSDNTLKVAGSGHYSEFWLENTGVENAAKDVEKLVDVDIEQLMKWDPDIIYLTTFSPAMPEDLYENRIEGFDFSSLSAVKNKQIYKIPLGSYRWYAPSCECALMLKWMAKTNYPEVFKDTDITEETKVFLKEFCSYEAADEEISALLNPQDTSLMNH